MTDRSESLPPQLRDALDIMGRRGKVVELTAPVTAPEAEEYPADTPCTATFREEPMPDTVYCQKRGYHQRHTSVHGGSEYYVWLDGDEGAGTE